MTTSDPLPFLSELIRVMQLRLLLRMDLLIHQSSGLTLSPEAEAYIERAPFPTLGPRAEFDAFSHELRDFAWDLEEEDNEDE